MAENSNGYSNYGTAPPVVGPFFLPGDYSPVWFDNGGVRVYGECVLPGIRILDARAAAGNAQEPWCYFTICTGDALCSQ